MVSAQLDRGLSRAATWPSGVVWQDGVDLQRPRESAYEVRQRREVRIIGPSTLEIFAWVDCIDELLAQLGKAAH